MKGEKDTLPPVLYMAVTDDEFELPIFVCDTAVELAKEMGTGAGTIYSSLCRSRDGVAVLRRLGLKYFRIDSQTGKILANNAARRKMRQVYGRKKREKTRA